MKKLYGKVNMLQGFCPKCQDLSFLDSTDSCLDCGTVVSHRRTVKRVSLGRYKRSLPSLARQAELLEQQKNRCYWCGSEFGEIAISRRGHIRTLAPHWDHFTPFAFTGSCDDIEFVAACSICNGYKKSNLFDDEDECRTYIVRRIRSFWFMPGDDVEEPTK